MANRNSTNSRISSANKVAADQLNYKGHAEDGAHFLSGLAAAPEDHYYGFTVGGDGAIVASITFEDNTNYTGTFTDIPLLGGMYYPIKCKTITLTSGELILWKTSIKY